MAKSNTQELRNASIRNLTGKPEVDPTVRTIFDAGEERVVRLGYAA
jgi:hypothetical protein